MNFKMYELSLKMTEKHLIRVVKKNIDLLIGEKKSYTKEEFTIIYAGSLGTEPITSEYQFVFRKTTDISLSFLLKFFVDKLATTWDSELKAMELFQALDQKGWVNHRMFKSTIVSNFITSYFGTLITLYLWNSDETKFKRHTKGILLRKRFYYSWKYFIDDKDIIEAYKEVDCKLDLKVLLEFFYIVSSDQTLDYFGFKSMFLNYYFDD